MQTDKVRLTKFSYQTSEFELLFVDCELLELAELLDIELLDEVDGLGLRKALKEIGKMRRNLWQFREIDESLLFSCVLWTFSSLTASSRTGEYLTKY